MVMVMSLIATTFPYHRDTFRSSMVLTLCLPSGTGAARAPTAAASSSTNITPYSGP